MMRLLRTAGFGFVLATVSCLGYAQEQSQSQPAKDSETQVASPQTVDQLPESSQAPAASQTQAPDNAGKQPENKPAKAAVRKNTTHKKKSGTQKHSSSQSGKVVVRNGGAKDASGQLTPALSQEQESHSRENTEQLLATTDSNLKQITGHPLSDSQQSMVDQIRTYVKQSRAASDAGDLYRAHTLAFKAHLLSDELSGR
jgi:hypothetical protein